MKKYEFLKNNSVARFFAIFVVVFGVVVAFGWIFDIATLQSPIGQVSIKFSAAISFVFSGVILYFVTRVHEGKFGLGFIAITTSSLVISLFVGTIVVSDFVGTYTGIENLLLKDSANIEHVVTGKPAIPTLVNFFLIVLVGVFVLSDSVTLHKSLKGLGIIIATIGGIALLGYHIGYPPLYYQYEGISNAMTYHASIFFVLLGGGLILSKYTPQQKNANIKIKRRLITLFLITSIVPVIFVGTWSYDSIGGDTTTEEFRDAVFVMGAVTISTTAVFAFLISKSLVKPILNLKKVAQNVADGNLNEKAVEDSDDELGDLSKAFNTMIENVKLYSELQVETETMRQTNKEKEEFAAMVSHELKTPLVPIQGYSELLMNERLGQLNEAQKNSLKIIFNNATRLSRLIQDILDVRKMELGKLKLAVRDTTTKEMIDQCLLAFKAITQSKGIMLIDNSQDVPLQCDPERIIQVLNNLVSNSLKFIPQENGMVEIHTKLEDSSVIFSVKDNGIGIPKDKQDSLFKKFYQVDTSLGRKGGGSGLGLVICKGIVESHKGKIWVESEADIGTTIYFSIPREMS